MNYPSHFSPKERVLHLLYVQTLSMSRPMGEFATWLLTGSAAIIGAVIVNVEAVGNVLSVGSLRWGLFALVLSLLAGVVVKQLSVAIAAGLELLEQLTKELESPQGVAAIRAINVSPDEFKTEMASAFLPPLRRLMVRGFEKGARDNLNAQKRFILLLCIQIYSIWMQGVFGIAGLLIFAFGIK